MSNYVAVDLKVIEVLVPEVARASGLSEDRILAGLVRLWHRAWSLTTDQIAHSELAGLFGPERIDDLAAALVGPFLERSSDAQPRSQSAYRVKGASRYLRLKESRRLGAMRTNAKKAARAYAQQRSQSEVGLSAQGDASQKSARSESAPERTLPDALSPSTEHHIYSPSESALFGLEPEQPKARKRVKSDTTDARHAPLVAALVAAGASFESRNARDVTRLLALATQAVGHDAAHEEVLARWRRALGRSGYPTVRALGELATHWGHFGAPRDTTLSDWSHPEQTPDANGDVKF